MATASDMSSNSTSKYLNRELSWLEFNQRVLDEALDPAIPLLERLKFLAITASNLDEFFRVRVGGLQLMVRQGSTRRDPSGMTPQEQLDAIAARVRQMADDQYECYRNDLEPQLAEAGMQRIRPEELTGMQRDVVEHVFDSEIHAILTPMAVTSTGEFPLLPNQNLNVCVRLAPDRETPDEDRFAVIPFAPASSRFISLPAETGYAYLLLEDAVRQFAGRFFVGETILECVPFRITRNADVSVRDDSAADLLVEMEQVLDERRTANCVRLEIADDGSDELVGFLQEALEITETETMRMAGPLDLSAFFRLTDRQGFDHLKYDSWPAQPSPDCPPGASLFDVIALQDVLLYHPYESFEPVVRLIEEAAKDPDVLSIKQTLYRTSRSSPIVEALMRAAEMGKQVTAIVELKARFDEARNIEWARALEQAGAQVIYGVKGLKTHAKTCIIVRREPEGIQRYMHFGTGNYNESTARLYSDVSLMTRDEELGDDAVAFINAITGYSQPQQYRKIAAAPIGLRDAVLEMIASETERKKQGQEARIMAKVNALVDPELIDALYEASQAGVKIQLNIRGICCLKPGVEGLSENIEVVSIVDRFLEHARIMYFHHGGEGRVYISSADWMPRNLDRRAELLVPVEDPTSRQRMIHILETYFQDTVKARRLLPDGSHERIVPTDDPPFRAQQHLYEEAREAIKRAEQQRRTLFEPHRPGEE
ncbi:Polyphosphate kinase [Maioricimonas rarisocia]|uniref:Polyphosphate kinase n=1 Tax=Maioricimonas rarisocia TaxID=2528026 RepID=A0A517Z0D5_9PLAN|nr:polyphosphate kinase 1 [Maioricimonas rarisocia]QDU35915.1 Polyphosphate kinase [Maioricimonas rarisocia]